MGLHLLLVEDNPDHALLAKLSLERDERIDTVDTCIDGASALKWLRGNGRHRPDAIVLDLCLPGMSGLELLERLKSEEGVRDVPVVLISSSALERDVHTGMERGAHAYVMKPLRPAELIELLDGAG